jgi:uncharacterized membrane protein YvbJ
LVYCVKCGAKNSDDAKVCSQCGASLYPIREERERYYRRYERECFGIPGGGAIIGLAIGVIIVIAGLLWFLQQTGVIGSNVSVWPFAAIIFGVLIVIGALFGMRRRY